jgi:hypothetical protein
MPFAGIKLRCRLVERYQQNRFFDFGHDRLFLRLKSSCKGRFLVRRQSANRFLDFGNRPHVIRRECGEFCNYSSFDPVISVKGLIVMAISNRLKSVKAWVGRLCLGSALFSSSCAHDGDSSDDSSQHHRHHGSGGGGGRYGHGQGGMFDQSNPSGSPSSVPGQ